MVKEEPKDSKCNGDEDYKDCSFPLTTAEKIIPNQIDSEVCYIEEDKNTECTILSSSATGHPDLIKTVERPAIKTRSECRYDDKGEQMEYKPSCETTEKPVHIKPEVTETPPVKALANGVENGIVESIETARTELRQACIAGPSFLITDSGTLSSRDLGNYFQQINYVEGNSLNTVLLPHPNGNNHQGVALFEGIQDGHTSLLLQSAIVQNESREFTCKLCGKVYKKRGFLENHIENHHIETCNCPECGKVLPTKKLEKHLETHNQKPAICKECGSVLKTHAGLLRHLQTHKGDQIYRCKECGKGFRRRDSLRQHLACHSSERNHICYICGKGFNRSGLLSRHIHTHNTERVFKCEECNKAFTTKINLDVHMKIHSTAKPFFCDDCGKAFRTKCLLAIHLRSHSSERPHLCTECGKGFKLRCQLLEHVRGHSTESPYSCTECDKSFKTRGRLREHKKTHNVIGQYTCELCGRVFKTQSSLRGHVLTHSAERNHVCGVCGKAFKKAAHLRQHFESHSSEKLHSCKECGKTFKMRSTLFSHEQTHRKERSFVCNICGKAFRRVQILKIHLKIHNKAKQFSCEACGAEFTSSFHLVRHMRTHVGWKPYVCNHCKKAFKNKKYLRRHQRKHQHLDNPELNETQMKPSSSETHYPSDEIKLKNISTPIPNNGAEFAEGEEAFATINCSTESDHSTAPCVNATDYLESEEVIIPHVSLSPNHLVS